MAKDFHLLFRMRAGMQGLQANVQRTRALEQLDLIRDQNLLKNAFQGMYLAVKKSLILKEMFVNYSCVSMRRRV